MTTSERGKMVDVKEVERLCICPKCPSWLEGCKERGAYCHSFVGKSRDIKTLNGCICGACPAHSKYALTSGAYCIHGSDAKLK
jgi:hypothetical protein